MMSTPLWQKLMSLVTTDKETQALFRQIDSLKKEIDSREKAKKQLSSQLSEYRQNYDEQAKAIRNIEASIEDLATLEQKKRNEEAAVFQQKALDALHKELATITSARNDYENELLSAWHSYDQLKEKLSQSEKSYTSHCALYDKEIEALNNEIQTLQKTIASQESEHTRKVQDLPQEWIDRYNHMKNRVENPLVPLYQKSCSACFYHVLPQDLARIQRNAILSCRNCYRYLYNDPAQEKEHSTATY